MLFSTVFKTYFSDILDILIVSYIIYQLLVLMRGTRAVQLMKGISIVVFGWLFSHFLHLSSLKWIIENLFSVGLIAIIIIFQPELRKALEQLGRGGFIQFNRQVKDQMVTKVTSEIVKAVVILSQKRMGALIVIERQTGLSDYMETGVTLEAKVGSELLHNIFLPNGPLHDGAVIIRDELMMSAGCYLPLSENPFISQDLGTRHRAAIGLSEMSDGIVIIVSEETGAISLAVQGGLIRDLDEGSLLEILYQRLMPAKEKKSWVSWRKQSKSKEGAKSE